MADKPRDKERQAGSSEHDWGADWESAFQAEEDAMFSFDEGEYEALFKQGAPMPGASGAQAAPSTDVAADADEEQGPGLAARLFARLAALPAMVGKLYTSPQLFTRALAYAVPLAIVALFVANLLLPSRSQQPLLPGTGETSQQPPPAGPFTLLEQTELRPPAVQDGSPTASHTPVQAEPIGRKWSLAAFLVPAPTENDAQQPAFVEIELDLVLLLHPDQPLPEEKKLLVRDIIFQFYSNHPLYDLRRFSLARGEMNRKLRAWLQKQAPDLAVQNIIFNHYLVS